MKSFEKIPKGEPEEQAKPEEEEKAETAGFEKEPYGYYQEQIKKDLPAIRDIAQFIRSYRESIGPWSETSIHLLSRTAKESLFEKYRDQKSILRELAEQKTGLKITDENFEEKFGFLSDEERREIIGAMTKELDRLDEVAELISNTAIDYGPKSILSWFNPPFSSEEEYRKIRKEIIVNIANFANAESLLKIKELLEELVSREKKFAKASSEYYREKHGSRHTTIYETQEDVDERGWKYNFGEDWENNFFESIPEDFQTNVSRITIIDKAKALKTKAGRPLKQPGGIYFPGTKSINIVSRVFFKSGGKYRFRVGSYHYIRILAHEIGHAIDIGEGDDLRRAELKLRFLEAVARADSMPTQYSFNTMKEEGLARGLGEDFAESFADFLTAPLEFKLFNPERYKAMEGIIAKLYPNVDIAEAQERIRKKVYEK